MRTRMKQRRLKLELTQNDVAKYIGKSRSAYSSYELGSREPGLKEIIMLKKLFKTKDDTIFLDDKDTKLDLNK